MPAGSGFGPTLLIIRIFRMVGIRLRMPTPGRKRRSQLGQGHRRPRYANAIHKGYRKQRHSTCSQTRRVQVQRRRQSPSIHFRISRTLQANCTSTHQSQFTPFTATTHLRCRSTRLEQSQRREDLQINDERRSVRTQLEAYLLSSDPREGMLQTRGLIYVFESDVSESTNFRSNASVH